jgi:Holliday junction resolvase YEN1
LWDVIGHGDIHHLADYAADFFIQHGRPLRIAVDEATWRFTNLTEQQVSKIREGEPAANPVEKTILWRILKLYRLNVQLLFVWDGLRKPGKTRNAGRGGGRVDKACIEMLHRLFNVLKVPYHQAPGEAEAECARLQQLGIVDAVWSDDGDSLMFGCTTLIKQHKQDQKPVAGQIRVYQAHLIAERLDLDPDSLVLFALLAGGDYDTTGLRGCGPQLARELCKRQVGLSRSLKNCTPHDLPVWRQSLVVELRRLRASVEVPPEFPDSKVVKGYCQPAISTDDQCRNLRCLREGWDRAIDHTKLRVVLRDHYNFTIREYLKHIAPFYLVRALTRDVDDDRRQENVKYGIIRKPTRSKKSDVGEDLTRPVEVKIKYSGAQVLLDWTGIDASKPEEDLSRFDAKNGTPYDPMLPVDAEILDCFLRHGLPEGALESTPVANKRKSKTKSAGESELKAPETTTPSRQPSRKGSSSKSGTPLKRGRVAKDDLGSVQSSKKLRPAEESGTVKKSPPRAVFKRLDLSELGLLVPPKPWNLPNSTVRTPIAKSVSPLRAGPSQRAPSPRLTPATDLIGVSSTTPRSSAKRVAVKDNQISTPPGTAFADEVDVKPGEVISPARVRELRVRAFMTKGSSPAHTSKLVQPTTDSLDRSRPLQPTQPPVIIDLT